MRGRALYDALIRIKPPSLAETEWAQNAGLNRGFFTNLKSADISPRTDTLRKLLRYIGRTDADLYKPAVVVSDHQPTRSADAGEAAEIVQLDLSLSMGPGTLIDDFVESEAVLFDIAMLRKYTRSPFDRLRLVTGIGNSHEPKFHHNDQFLIDINERQLTRIDGYYWITLHGAHALKRLRPIGRNRIEVISENPDFGPQEVDAEDLRIEGRAVWVSRGL